MKTTVMNFIGIVKDVTDGFNSDGIKEILTNWIDPLTTTLLWLIPALYAIAAISTSLKWSTKSEREKEQQPLFPLLQKHLFNAIITELIPVIIKILL